MSNMQTIYVCGLPSPNYELNKYTSGRSYMILLTNPMTHITKSYFEIQAENPYGYNSIC